MNLKWWQLFNAVLHQSTNISDTPERSTNQKDAAKIHRVWECRLQKLFVQQRDWKCCVLWSFCLVSRCNDTPHLLTSHVQKHNGYELRPNSRLRKCMSRDLWAACQQQVLQICKQAICACVCQTNSSFLNLKCIE